MIEEVVEVGANDVGSVEGERSTTTEHRPEERVRGPFGEECADIAQVDQPGEEIAGPVLRGDKARDGRRAWVAERLETEGDRVAIENGVGIDAEEDFCIRVGVEPHGERAALTDVLPQTGNGPRHVARVDAKGKLDPVRGGTSVG